MLPISSILRNAPILRELTVRWNALLDDQAIKGISDGTLGRYLQRLEISESNDFEEVLDMAAARKKKVDEMIENGCNWKEDITLLKEIGIVCETDFEPSWDREKVAEKVEALKEAGITISYSDPYND